MLKTIALGIVATAALYSSPAPQAALSSKTVWDGVYTDEQAMRGRLGYENHCASCHGTDLATGRAIPLSGRNFLERWREDRLDTLFNYMKTAMPRGAGGSLTEAVYVEIFAYVLRGNGFPVGSEPITIPGLATIHLIGKDGPKPVPDGALVTTVGCMTRGPDNEWLLTRSTEPVRTRKPYETTQDELRAAQASPPGSLTFVLADFDALPGSRPANFEGFRMQAKGFIVRQPGAERISLFHLGMVSAACPK